MICATVKNDTVTGLIVIQAEQIKEIEAALSCEIVDARPYGLIVGDLRTAAGWTRNAGGEQMILPLLDAEKYDSYTLAMRRANEAEEQAELAMGKAAEAEERAETVADEALAEALAILSGEVDE